MKLPCNVIQDLLPLYHDGVCSDESAGLVQAHLTECEACSAMLDALKGEIDAAHPPADEVKPLTEIQKSIRKGNRRALRRGMLAAVALILVVALIGSGIWYNRIGKYYDAVADKMKPITKEMGRMGSGTHYLEAGAYGVILKKPMVFSDSGFITVGSIDLTVNYLKGIYNEVAWGEELYLDLFFYPDQQGGYDFAVNFTFRTVGQEQDGVKYLQGWYWLNPDLTLDTDGRTYMQDQLDAYPVLLEEYRPDIEALFAVVEEQFGIRYLE